MKYRCSKIFINTFSIICVLNSCKDKTQEKLLQESNFHLTQANACMQSENQRLHSGFQALMYNEIEVERISYLEKYARDLNENTTLLSKVIATLKESKTPDIKKLYQQYNALQMSYTQLKSRIKDSFNNVMLDTNINAFMNLNEEHFIQKYIVSDANQFKIKLTILEADALLNEHFFMENMLYNITPKPSCGSSMLMAIATPNKCVYKKGEKMEITAIIGNYVRTNKAKANVNGQTVVAKDGVFLYSKSITESPGNYTIRMYLNLDHNGMRETYPAEVSYKVE